MKRTFVTATLLSALALSAVAQESQISTNTLNTAVPARWTYSYIVENETSTKQFNKGNSSLDFINWLSINYNMSNTATLLLRPTWIMTNKGTDTSDGLVEGGTVLGDFKVMYDDYYAIFGENNKTEFTGHVYLPTSKSSQNAGQITRLRTEWDTSIFQNVNFKFGNYTNINYYAHEHQSSVDPVSGARSATVAGKLEQKLYLNYMPNGKWTLGTASGFIDAWYRGDAKNGVASNHTDILESEINAEWRPGYIGKLFVSYLNRTKVDGGKFSFGHYNDNYVYFKATFPFN